MCSAADDPTTYGYAHEHEADPRSPCKGCYSLAAAHTLRAPSEGDAIERAVRWYFSASDDLTLSHILDAYARASTPEIPDRADSYVVGYDLEALAEADATPDRADLDVERLADWLERAQVPWVKAPRSEYVRIADRILAGRDALATPDRADLASEKRDAWRAGWNAARESPPGHTRYIPPSNTIDPSDGGRDDR